LALNSQGKALNSRGKALNSQGKALNSQGKALNSRARTDSAQPSRMACGADSCGHMRTVAGRQLSAGLI